MGGIASIISGVVTVVGLLASALVALLSPIGLTIAAIAGLAAFILHATGAGAKALDWLGEKFESLRASAVASYQGIGNALAAGDISQAAKILWLALSVEWQKGVNLLKSYWIDFKDFFLTIATDAFYGAVAFLAEAWAGMQSLWVETVALELSTMGYKLVETGGIQEALKQVRTGRRIDLLVTDVILPIASGKAVADAVAAERPGMPTLYISGYAEEYIVRHGVIEPGVRFLCKPFTTEALALAVRETLDAALARTHALESPARAEFRRVLVVDDDVDVADSIADFLEIEGYEVRTAQTGAEALACLADESHSLVFLDINLPDMSGYDLVRHLRSMDAGAPRVVALSGHDPDPEQRELFDGYLVKPIAIQALRDALAVVSVR